WAKLGARMLRLALPVALSSALAFPAQVFAQRRQPTAQSKEPATVTPSPAAPVDGQAASAKAEGTGVQRVAILRLHFSGDVPEASREHFLSRMVEGLAVARFQVVSGATVQDRLASQSAKLAACADGGCYPNVAELLQ